MDADGECIGCPVGAVCNATGNALATLDVLPGYWRVSDASYKVLKCDFAEACVGGQDAHMMCNDGFEGPYCDCPPPNSAPFSKAP